MSSILCNIIPLILIVIIFIRLKNTDLYLCAILIVMTMAESAFIKTIGFKLNIPGLPIFLQWNSVVLIVFAFISIIAVRKHPFYTPIRKHNVLYLSLLGFALLIVVHVPISWIVSEHIRIGSLMTMVERLAFPLGIYFWVTILRRSNWQNIITLIDTIAWISTMLGVVYILNTLNVPLYPFVAYQTTSFANTIIIRDFLTIPPWIFLSFSWFLVQTDFKSKIGVIVLLLVGIFTYTRSMVFSLILAFILYVFLKAFVNHRIKIAITNILLTVIVFAIVYCFLGPYVKNNFQYLFYRFEEIEEEGFEKSSLGARFKTFSIIGEDSPRELFVLGVGFRYDETSKSMQFSSHDLPTVIGDSLWITTIYFYGLVGIILVALIYISAMIRLLSIIIRNNENSIIHLPLFLSIIMLIFMSFSGAAYMYQNPFPTAFIFSLIILSSYRNINLKCG